MCLLGFNIQEITSLTVLVQSDEVITTTIMSLLWLQMYLSDSYDSLSLSLASASDLEA